MSEPLPNPAGSRPKRGTTRRQFIGRSAGVALAVGGVGSFIGACGGSSNEVVVLTWGGTYLAPQVSEGLEKRFGITLRPIPGASDSDFLTKLKAGGGSQYDVVIGNCGYAPLYMEADLIEPLDLHSLESAAQLYPEFREDTRFPYLLEPNKALCFPNTWGPYSMTFNTTVPYQPSKPYSWKALFGAPSGKVLFHGPTAEDQLPYGGLTNGVPLKRIYDMSGSELQKAGEALRGLKPYQISESDETTSSRYKSGEAYIGTAFGLGVGELIDQSAGRPVAESVVPIEGAIGALDGLQLVKGARNKENALKFIDFFGGKQNQKFLFEALKYASCNRAAIEGLIAAGGSNAKFIEAAKMNDPSVAAALEQVRPATHGQEWAAVFDEVQAS